jgi:ATP-dependent DNA ligase
MKYESYSYIFPPRPTQTTKHTELYKYDNGNFIAQPKYNGTCCNVFISENQLKVMNRHKGEISSNYKHIDFNGLHSGKGWMVLSGEFLNKNKLGEDEKPFNLKFVIWDILVYENKYLLGETLENRLKLLEKLYPCVSITIGKNKMQCFDHLCCTKYENIYKAPSYVNNFSQLYDSIVKTDLYEGIVLKRKDSVLSLGLVENNNSAWQIKCRKPTKNYAF